MNELKIVEEIKELESKMALIEEKQKDLGKEWNALYSKKVEIKDILTEIAFSKRDLSGTYFDKNVNFFQDSEVFQSKAEIKRYLKMFCGKKCIMTKTYMCGKLNELVHNEYEPEIIISFTENKITFETGNFYFYNDIKKARKTKNGIKIELATGLTTTRIYIEIVD